MIQNTHHDLNITFQNTFMMFFHDIVGVIPKTAIVTQRLVNPSKMFVECHHKSEQAKKEGNCQSQARLKPKK